MTRPWPYRPRLALAALLLGVWALAGAGHAARDTVVLGAEVWRLADLCLSGDLLAEDEDCGLCLMSTALAAPPVGIHGPPPRPMTGVAPSATTPIAQRLIASPPRGPPHRLRT